MHLHLEPLGGIAGDMFCAAMLDLFPHWEAPFRAELARVGLDRRFHFELVKPGAQVLSGRYLELRIDGERHRHRAGDSTGDSAGDNIGDHVGHDASGGSRSYREISQILEDLHLESQVHQRASDIFRTLAQAEAQVHGTAIDQVHFHELGAWDAVFDVVAAAWLLVRVGDATWSCGAIPQGSGTVRTAHGVLPVPAPATALLLRGCPLYQDEFKGERVTPTGAAIVKTIAPSFAPRYEPACLHSLGVGFGKRIFPGLSNILRVCRLEPGAVGDSSEGAVEVGTTEPICVVEFEVDDQTSEDLAAAVERLRAHAGVVDLNQQTLLGKKGRVTMGLRALVKPEHKGAVIDACFSETTTLGVRWYFAERRVLRRELRTVRVEENEVRVKHAQRPKQQSTVKADMDDLMVGDRASRERLRRLAESAALDSKTGISDD